MGQLPALYFRCFHNTKYHHPVIWNQIGSLEGSSYFWESSLYDNFTIL